MTDTTHRRLKQIRIYPFSVFAKVIFISKDDVSLYASTSIEILCLSPRKHSFRHTTDQKEYAEILYQLFMKHLIQRVGIISVISHPDESLFIVSAKELVECHRIHKEGVYSAHTKCGQFLKGEFQKRACGYDVQLGIVFLEKAQCHNGFGAFLYFIEKQQRHSLFYGDINVIAYLLSYQTDIDISLKKTFYCPVALKVNLCKILEFFTEMPYG